LRLDRILDIAVLRESAGAHGRTSFDAAINGRRRVFVDPRRAACRGRLVADVRRQVLD
jgi:hypothetical protein